MKQNDGFERERQPSFWPESSSTQVVRQAQSRYARHPYDFLLVMARMQ